MAKEEIHRVLEVALATESVVWLRRRFDGRPWRGFIVGMSDGWALVHVLNIATMGLNGYTAFRVKDLESCHEDESFVPAALKLKGVRPVYQPDLLLVDAAGLLSSASALFPLIELFEEKERPQFYVGRVVRFGKRKVHLQVVTRGGTWSEIYKCDCQKITRIDFGDGYDEALWLVARHQPRSQPERPNS